MCMCSRYLLLFILPTYVHIPNIKVYFSALWIFYITTGHVADGHCITRSLLFFKFCTPVTYNASAKAGITKHVGARMVRVVPIWRHWRLYIRNVSLLYTYGSCVHSFQVPVFEANWKKGQCYGVEMGELGTDLANKDNVISWWVQEKRFVVANKDCRNLWSSPPVTHAYNTSTSLTILRLWIYLIK